MAKTEIEQYTNNFCQFIKKERREGNTEKRKAIAKLFALHANAIKAVVKENKCCGHTCEDTLSVLDFQANDKFGRDNSQKKYGNIHC